MKTTVDLPPELVRELKLQAINEGKKLRETIADLLRRGLAAKKAEPLRTPHRVQLPLVECPHSADLGPGRVAEILSEQETGWHRDAS